MFKCTKCYVGRILFRGNRWCCNHCGACNINVDRMKNEMLNNLAPAIEGRVINPKNSGVIIHGD